MKPKGQISVEFIIVLILLLSLFLFSLWVFSEKNTAYIHSRESGEAKLLAEKLARTINTVYLSGNGTAATVLLEKNFDLNIIVSGNAVQAIWGENYSDAAVLTDKITVNSLSAGKTINVKNLNGTIVIQNAQ